MTVFDGIKRFLGFGRNGGSDGIPCHEALRLVHEFLDGELDGVSRAEVEAHFEVCKRCYPHLRLERRFREAIQRACARGTAPPELRDRVVAMVSRGRPDA